MTSHTSVNLNLMSQKGVITFNINQQMVKIKIWLVNICISIYEMSEKISMFFWLWNRCSFCKSEDFPTLVGGERVPWGNN